MLKGPPADEDRCLVYLVCLVFWLNETNQMNQINLSRQSGGTE
jgi:hypothetical protein